MSCYLITYKDGHKVARPVTTKEEYLLLRNSKAQIENLAKARKGDDAAKRKLIQFNYSCIPNDDGSLKGAKQISTTVGMDIDGLNPEELDAIAQKILSKKEELGLLMLEKSARLHGFHLVFKRQPNLDQEQNLRWASDLLGVEYDSGAKDITRVFFTTTNNDLLFLDEELFTSQPAAQQDPSQPPLERGGVQTNDKCPETQAQVSKDDNSTLDNSSLPEGQPIPHSTFNIQNYENLVHELEILLGGVPMHGSRNQFIFTMACNLRYICNHDPDWVARILPTYGEAKDKWYSTIKSACNRAMTVNMPKIMKKAIERVKAREEEQQQEDEEEVEGVDGSGNGTLPPHMPKTLPAMIRLLVSKTPDIYKPAVAHAVFPALAAHLWHTRFKYIDNVEHEATLMNVLMAGTGAGKSCITGPIDSIMRDIRERDRINMEKEQQWKDEMSTKGANKDKKKRPEGIIIQEVDADMTNAAFVLRMAEAEEHFLYVRMNEIEQFNALKTSARSDSQFQIMCLAFDPGNSYGQTRVGVQSVSKRVTIRFNWNASTTIRKGQQYFSKVLTDGPISRINFCTIPEQPIGAEMPVYGKYDAKFDEKLKPYIDNLNAARGLIECQEAFALAQKLHDENAEFARLSQSRTFENLSFRANVIAYLKAMILYVANGYKWEKSFENFIRWSEQYDMWCKMHFFAEAIEKAEGEVQVTKRGPRNLLEELPDRFTYDDAVAVRRKQNLHSGKTKNMLSAWKHRGYIVETTNGMWEKVFSK
ncbi:MAG: hypothetical protein E7104_03665 [Prevotella sp.]|jgi:hypothetical protein|nr:hypothetical protein [Prevotella sp.]